MPEAGPETPAGTKLVAGCSLAFWAGAIIAGRLIAYIEIRERDVGLWTTCC